jgi:hypothetical protein
MLGEKLGEAQAATVTRVLPTEGSSPRFETSVDGGGTLLGVPVKFLATYWSEVRADGSIYGECPNSGVFMTEDGEAATFIASGAGGFTSEGGAFFRGAVYFQTSGSKLARLNGICGVHEWDVDAEGNGKWVIWEWK